jgi:hypothetical protein
VQAGFNARNDKELARVVDFYLDIVRMIDQLLMRYATANEYVELAGDGGARVMQVWNNKLISGRWIYDIAPDSQLRVDTARDMQLDMQIYNVTGKDPLVNRGYLLQRMFRRRGYDPRKAIVPPPPPKPEKPSISFNFKGEDLSIPLVVQLLEQNGLVPPGSTEMINQAVQSGMLHGPAPKASQPQGHAEGQPPHPGTPMPQREAISAHMASNSGGRQNAPGAGNFRAEQVK